MYIFIKFYYHFFSRLYIILVIEVDSIYISNTAKKINQSVDAIPMSFSFLLNLLFYLYLFIFFLFLIDIYISFFFISLNTIMILLLFTILHNYVSKRIYFRI